MHKERENLTTIRNDSEFDHNDEDIFSVEEINIEEMAIDGICGVY